MFSRSQLYQMCVGRVYIHLTEQRAEQWRWMGQERWQAALCFPAEESRLLLDSLLEGG